MAADGAARAVVLREFYVSTGYNGEQPIAGFLPVDSGTIVAFASHAFTDQVAGTGGSLKRRIRTRVMAEQMKEIFDAGRKKFELYSKNQYLGTQKGFALLWWES